MSEENDELRRQIDAVMTNMRDRESELYGGQPKEGLLISSVYGDPTKLSQTQKKAEEENKQGKEKLSSR